MGKTLDFFLRSPPIFIVEDFGITCLIKYMVCRSALNAVYKDRLNLVEDGRRSGRTMRMGNEGERDVVIRIEM